MKHTLELRDSSAHPALRVLAWLLGLRFSPTLTLQASSPGQTGGAPSSPGAHPARRRSDTAASAVTARPPRTEPLLKAHRDTLTGLATREHLADTGDAWTRELAERGLALCVLHVGLEGCASVTERYGCEAGDQALMQVAKRLRQLARDEDRVVRQGDEFLLLLSCPAAEAASFSRSAAARVVTELQRPVPYRTVSRLGIACNVGSALWPADGNGSLAVVLHQAEQALAMARRSGRGQTRQYSSIGQAAAA